MEDFHLQAVDHACHTEKAPREAGPVINGYAAPREERLDGADLTVAGPGGGVYARRSVERYSRGPEVAATNDGMRRTVRSR
jgi:hypothetical protein